MFFKKNKKDESAFASAAVKTMADREEILEEDIDETDEEGINNDGREEEGEVEKELKDIYSKDGEMPDLKNFETRHDKKVKTFLVGMVVFFALLAVSAWAGFFILKPYERFGGKSVQFEITGPEQVVSGTETVLEISYINKEDVPLGEASITLFTTPGFFLKESNPPQGEKGAWELGSIEKGASGKIEIKGIIIGEKDSKFTLTGTLNYRPANFNSEFEKVANYVAKIESTVLDIEASGPADAEPGKEMEFIVKYKNLSTENAEKVAINPVFSEKFNFVSAEPAPDKKGRWVFAELKAEEEGEIKIKGIYSSEASGDIAEKFQIGFIVTGDKFISQKESIVPVRISKSDLILNLNSEKPGPADFGETLQFSINYKNNITEDLGDITIKAVFDPKPASGTRSPLLWSSITDTNRGTKKSFEISWNKTNIPALAKLAPGEEGVINFGISLIDKPFTDLEGEYEISLVSEAKIGKIGGVAADKLVQSERINIPLNSDVAISAEGRYFNDDNIAVGSGPVPPRVGEKTTYKIFWTIDNTLHGLNNIVMAGTLPAGATWENISYAERGNISYEESSRKIFWRMDNLPKEINKAQVNFSISIKPESGDIGKILTILGITNFEAQDETTGGAIVLTEPPITTELIGDPEAQGKGTVR
jgi:hypothetical protein